MISKEELEIKIKVARKKMYRLWNERGYTDKNVLAASIELDNLLNQYSKLTSSSLNLINYQGFSSKT